MGSARSVVALVTHHAHRGPGASRLGPNKSRPTFRLIPPSYPFSSASMSQATSPQSIAALQKMIDVKNSTYVKLPVVVLGMLRNPGWGFGFLLVTDFTDLECSLYNRNVSVPSSLHQDIYVGGKQLRDSQIMSISIKADSLDGIWRSISSFSPHMGTYNYADETLGIFAAEGVVANVSFRAKIFRGCVDGFLSYVRVATRSSLGAPSIAKEFEPNLAQLMERYTDYIDARLYDRLMPVFPVEKYMRRPGAKRVKTEQDRKQRAEMERARAQVERARVEKVRPAVAPAPSQGSVPARILAPTVSTPVSAPAPAPIAAPPTASPGAPILPSSAVPSAAPVTPSPSFTPPLSLTPRGHTAAAPFPSWCTLDPALVAEGARFRIAAHVAHLDPDARVFVKPFRRTLKLAPLRLALAAHSSLAARAHVEISSESEWCAFLAIDEIEETLDQLPQLSARLALLPGREVLLVVERRLSRLDFGYSRPYWGLVSMLTDLLHN